MTNWLPLLFDSGLSVLLIVTIAYCARLSGRIRTMQDTRGELAGMITQFDQATGRAMTTLAELQVTAKRITEALQLKIEKANFLADDLAFLIEKSSKLLHQLEQQTKAVRAETLAAKPKPAPEIQAPSPPVQVHQMKPKLGSWQPANSDIPSSVKSAASLEALLNRLASSTGAGPAAAPKPAARQPERAASPRTDAERELLEALKSGQ